MRDSTLRQGKRRLRGLALASAATLGFVQVSQGVTYTSVSTSGGLWSNPDIWMHSPMPPTPRSPGNSGADSYLVTIEEPVTLDLHRTVSSLSIVDSSQLTWTSLGSPILTLDNGPISNAGLMSLNDGDTLACGGFVTLDGAGVTMLTAPTSRISGSISGRLQVNGHTIRGQGVIGGTNFGLTNNGGLVVADIGGQTLTLDPGSGTNNFALTNGGIFRATNGATLLLTAGEFNCGGGTIEATSGSFVDLSFAAINFGALSASGSSLFRVVGGSGAGSNRLNSVSITQGTTIEMRDGRGLSLTGMISNNGQIVVKPSVSQSTVLGIDGTVTLSGNGTIMLEDPHSSRLVQASPGALLIQQSGHTIAGAGSIGSTGVLQIDNRGRLIANRSGQALRWALADGANANSGTMLATGGGILNFIGIGNTVLDNSGGLIEASNGSNVNLSRLTIAGGELHSSSTGSFIVNSEVHLRDLTHSAVTRVAFSLFLNGQINNDAGIINVADSGDIYLDGDTTLVGTGDIVLSGPATISKLLTPAAATLTNESNLIRGAGNVGGGMISVLNNGTIDARVNGATLTLQPASAGAFTNTGTLMASDGGILFLQSGVFNNNASGTIRATDGSQVIVASGSNLTLNQQGDAKIQADANATVEVRGNNVTISGGKLVSNTVADSLDPSSRIRIGGSEPHFNGVTNEAYLDVAAGNAIARDMINKGFIAITNDRTLGLENTFTLMGDGQAGNGEVQIAGTTLGSVLRIRDAVTIDGNGTIQIDAGAGGVRSSIFGSGADPELTNRVTIRGEGRIAGGLLSQDDLRLINEGDIIARRGSFGSSLDIRAKSATGGFDLINEASGNLIAQRLTTLLIENTVNNKGCIIAEEDGTVVLNNATISAAGAAVGVGGKIVANSGTVLLDQTPASGPPTRIIGGTLQTLGTGKIINPTAAVLDGSSGAAGGVRVQGDVVGASGSSTTATGTLTFSLGGNITLTPNTGLTSLIINGTTSFAGDGAVRLMMPMSTGAAQLTGQTGSSPVLTIGPGMVIEGPQGSIGGGGLIIANQGIIRAAMLSGPDTPFGPGEGITSSLDLLSIPVTNTGTLQANTGSKLRLNNAQVTNTGGTIRAEDNAVVELTGLATIDGGMLDTAGSGVIRNVGSGGLIAFIENHGRFDTANGATTDIVNGTVVNTGTILLSSTGAATTLRIVGNAVLSGNGSVILSDNPNNRIIGGGAGTPTLVNQNNTIRGAGTIDLGNMLGPGITFLNAPTTGNIIADGINPLTLSGDWLNQGFMHAQGPGGLRLIPGSDSGNDGRMLIDAASRLQVEGAFELDNSATLTIHGTANGAILNRGQGIIDGSGTINGNPVNGGRLKPTAAPASAGQTGVMRINGNFQQQPTGTLDAEIEEVIALGDGGLASNRLDVTGAAALDGSLAVSFVGEAVALPGDSFTVLTFGSRSGDLTVVNDTPYPGLIFNKVYDATSLTLDLDALGGDANLDALVNLQDFNILAANFGATGANWLTADFTGDGLVNLADFNRLAANFGQGAAPAGPTPQDWAVLAAAVPEPTGSLLCSGAAVSLCRRRRRRHLRGIPGRRLAAHDPLI